MTDTLPFHSRRSPVLARRGIVASSHPLASQAGLEILRAGGNAADAAVATAAALAVMEPTSTGIGGDCFSLFFDGGTRSVHAVNGSGRAPAGLSIGALTARGVHDRIPHKSPFSPTVPGAAAGWADTVARHGRLPLADVLTPAIALADDGHPVAPLIARYWQREERAIAAASGNGGELLLEGRAPRAGEIWRNPGLAGVLRELAEGGPDAFYRGRAARAIAEVMEALGGFLSEDDLAAHASTFEDPISTTYRGYRVYECAPNGQGLTALIALNILEGYDIRSLAPRSPAYLHAVIEALRLAFADARWYVADPACQAIPVAELLDKAYAAERRRLIDPTRACADVYTGAPVISSDTVYLAAADGEGNACSFINSNYEGFGSAIVPKGCGFSLQSRAVGFSLDPAHPNALAPGKRPYHTIIPAMSTDANGDLHACFGVMGGFNQPQGHVQVFLNLVDRDWDPQAALDEPRISIYADPPGSGIHVEQGIRVETMSALAALGHPIVPTSGFLRTHVFGRGQIILRNPATGVLTAGSDPRADGAAVGF